MGGGGERTEPPRPHNTRYPQHLLYSYKSKLVSLKAVVARINVMHRKNLQTFSRELKNLESYEDLEKLVRRGIAYHHGGITTHTHTCLSPYY
jgi:hypothetical protein